LVVYNDFDGLCLSQRFIMLFRDVPAVCKLECCLFMIGFFK